MQADIERVRAEARQIDDLEDGMQKNEFSGALAMAAGQSLGQPSLAMPAPHVYRQAALARRATAICWPGHLSAYPVRIIEFVWQISLSGAA